MRRYVIIGSGGVAEGVAAPLHAAGTAVVVIADGERPGTPRGKTPPPGRPDAQVGDLRLAAGPSEVRLHHEDVLVFATTPRETEAAVREWRRRPVEQAGAASAELIPAVLLGVLLRGLDDERVVRRPFAALLGAVVAIRGSNRTPARGRGSASATADAFWLGAVPAGEQPSPREERAVYQLAADLVHAGFAAQVVDDVESGAAALPRESTAHDLSATPTSPPVLAPAGRSGPYGDRPWRGCPT